MITFHFQAPDARFDSPEGKTAFLDIHWEFDEDPVQHQPGCDLIAISAEGHALQQLLQKFGNLPYVRGRSRWPQPWADFIWENIDV